MGKVRGGLITVGNLSSMSSSGVLEVRADDNKNPI